MLFWLPASADEITLRLPADTLTVDDSAFRDCAEISAVVLPEGLRAIGAYAFSGCSALRDVYIPASVTSIGEQAFPSTAEIRYESGSYAETWAKENGFAAEVKYFALLIGQEYTGTPDELYGCFRDVSSMQAMLQTMNATPYQVTVCHDLTAAGILTAIDAAFSSARDSDVCLLYYSGHGGYSSMQEYLGALIGVDSRFVTMSQLKNTLDRSKGKKIVILDSCYSGAAIAAASLTAESVQIDLEAVNAAIIAAFTRTSRNALAADGYYVLTAASASETSASVGAPVDNDVIYFGAFTYGLLHASGYDEISGTPLSALQADSNRDGSISLSEGYAHAYAKALSFNSGQHAQCYPRGSVFPLWGR